VNFPDLSVFGFQLLKSLPWPVPVGMPLQIGGTCFPVLSVYRRRVHATFDSQSFFEPKRPHAAHGSKTMNGFMPNLKFETTVITFRYDV
jgi:hypothetical protein